MFRPSYRLLSGYSLDPGFSTRLDTAAINEITYQVRWEPLKKGPRGAYFEIIDVDPASNCYYEPVNLDSEEVLLQNGLAPSEGNPQFHQQFVYTIAMRVLHHFEHSLGRKIIWPARLVTLPGPGSAEEKRQHQYIPRLRIYPHAFRNANAYYDPDKRALLFGYFEAAMQVNGTNLPGGTVFTCLSPDIVAHELTHAILDSIHPRFVENTNPDVAAFHEAFADLVALLQRFTITPLVEHQIASTRGDLTEFSFLGELATQFGNALENSRGSLRGAIGRYDEKKKKWVRHDPDPSAYHTVFEAHDRGSLLVATVFDAFIRLYNAKTADLLRIATNGSGILQPGAIHPDLVKRLAGTACKIAEHLLHICIRSLDYCPPLDISFGDFLRAMITADLDMSPKDNSGYRLALIEAFRAWGIFPDRVNTLSIESLRWSGPTHLDAAEVKALQFVAKSMKTELRKIIDLSLQEDIEEDSPPKPKGGGASRGTKKESIRKQIFDESLRIQAFLHGLLMTDKKAVLGAKAWSVFLTKLGLTDQPVTFEYEGEELTSGSVPKVEVHKVRPVYRVGREERLLEQVVITLSQTFRVDNGSYKGAKFRGGSTLIINMSRDYDVEYIIYKNISSQERFTRQMDFQTGKDVSFRARSESMYGEESAYKAVNFKHLHFHNCI